MLKAASAREAESSLRETYYLRAYISDWIYKKLPPNAGTITIA